VHVALNVSFVTPGEMGGLEVYARELTRTLVRRSDVRVTLLLNRVAAADGAWRELGDSLVLDCDPRRRIDWVRADQLSVPRAGARLGVDVVHSLGSTGPSRGPFARVVTVHDLNYLAVPEAHFGLRALGMRVLVPLAVRRSHRVIAPSEHTRQDLVDRLGTPAGKVDVVPEGVGQRPAEVSADAEGARRDVGAGDRRVVLSVSAKRPHKNLLRLIEALARIPPERRPLLVLPGYPTPHERELEDRAAELGVAGSVRFLAWVSSAQLEGLYAAADCFVFPSLYEGFGLPVLEAMARGVPVATSGRASLAEVAGDAALLFDPEDPASIASSIERVLGDRDLADGLSRAGRERSRRFTWDQAAAGTVASYRRALGGSE
jgi:glycosyltransferase involved in cell wall biosynthesis